MGRLLEGGYIGKKSQFGFGPVKAEIFVAHPSKDFKKAVCSVTLDVRV